MKKEVFWLILTSTFMFLWTIPSNPKAEVDVFLFKAHEEQIRWILHDVHMYLTFIVLTGVIHRLVCRFGKWHESRVTLVWFCFAIFRIVEYFTFRGLIPILPIVLGLSVWSFAKMYNGAKNTNS